MDTLLPEDLKRELGRYSHKEKFTLVMRELTRQTYILKLLLNGPIFTKYLTIEPVIMYEEIRWIVLLGADDLLTTDQTARISPYCCTILGQSINQLKSIIRQLDADVN
jgi:hypothetical protein